ncbi:MAG TPA: TadE/TadG family type IV pilus assembly protein, partial [Gemmatimonadaceae bacterium]|nr:TadE/TadG family type IV pilus assembly protein [Gemmatimonadaceae bacterium]
MKRAIRRSLTRIVRREEGTALLELAVAIPILLLLVIGVVDYARLYTTSITVANATMAAGQYGAAGPPWNE